MPLFLVLLGLVHARHLARESALSRESGKFPSARYESEGTVRSRGAQEGSLRTATKKSDSQANTLRVLPGASMPLKHWRDEPSLPRVSEPLAPQPWLSHLEGRALVQGTVLAQRDPHADVLLNVIRDSFLD